MNWVLLRGLAREKGHWHGFDQRLREACGGEVLCMDLPGAGEERQRPCPWTIAEIARDVRERFVAERERIGGRWGVLALSLGGMVALEWCDRFPDDFERAVIINSSSSESPTLDRMRWSALSRMPWVVLERDPVRRERQVVAMTSRLDPEQQAHFVRLNAEIARQRPLNRATFLRQIVAASRFRVPRGGLRPQVLVLGSRGDQLLNCRCSERLAEALNAPLRMHPSGGHDLVLDAPAWVCEQVTAFCDQPAPADRESAAARPTASAAS